MRHGYTTGSCAAAAAKAATYLLLMGIKKENVIIETPKGIRYDAKILQLEAKDGAVSCAVEKDGGDDPDVTSGLLIYAEIKIKHIWDDVYRESIVTIDGGEGVGRVTKPGLDQPVGNAAINHIPREMITKEVLEVCKLADFHGEISVIVSVPKGDEIAQKTFNPRLGIVGGISIIGTSGIVEPMSTQALLDTIKVELNQRKEQGFSYVAVTPGNYGRDYMSSAYDYDIDRSVKCSNFIGNTIDMAIELGFESMLLTGHIGKLIKLSGGIMNTHSKEGDCRMELISAAALKCGVNPKTVLNILDCVVTEEGVRLLLQDGKKKQVMDYIMEKIMFYLNKRADGKIKIECVMYSNEFGELAKSKGADEWLTLLAQEQEQ
ncbi:MAG: cobalamin biosynthesis protein CbiD [Lachnospiraceae bacterium]|nr:cobalamin biosynthesis protein CbiD [Lachnospiraceae bacterium]